VRALGSASEALLGRSVATDLTILHPRKRFYAGGSQSVRGYGENQLGPRVLTIDPGKLLNARVSGEDTLPPLCTREEVIGGTCVAATTIGSSEFDPRPIGGSTLLEGSVEYRFSIWGPLEMALFVDGGIVGEGDVNTITEGTGAITPGFGFRYETPVGPIRVDLGIKPRLAEDLAIVTEIVDENGQRRIVPLQQQKAYDPLEDASNKWWRQVLDRLTLHLSIGQAF
jgi:translocation and assembly module TamA